MNRDTNAVLEDIRKILDPIDEARELSEKEEAALRTLSSKLSGTRLNTIDLDLVPPSVVKALHKKRLIHATFSIRFTDKGCDIADRL